MNEAASRAIVVKIGGSTLGSGDTSIADCAALHRSGRRVVLVHGGGARVSEWLERLAIPVEFHDGLRKTDSAAREIIVAILGGLVNTQIVQQLAALGVGAVGLSGADAGILRSPLSPRGLGFVGEAPQCDPSALNALLEAGLLPVVAPIGLTPDGDELLNINADSAAGAIAAALQAEALIVLSDIPGVIDGAGAVERDVDAERIRALRAAGIIRNGMLPKVAACQTAAAGGATARIVDGRMGGAVCAALHGEIGTVVH